jgi:hypothetical protein
VLSGGREGPGHVGVITLTDTAEVSEFCMVGITLLALEYELLGSEFLQVRSLNHFIKSPGNAC